MAAGNKPKGKFLSFHLEGEETDSEKFVMGVPLGSDQRKYFFRKIPEFTGSDVEWFYPFKSENGQSYGVAFRLNSKSAVKLNDLCRTYPGKLFGINVVGSLFKAVIIDRPSTDGIIVLWSGLTENHLTLFRTKFPHVDDFQGGNSQTTSGPQFNLPKKNNPFKFPKKKTE